MRIATATFISVALGACSDDVTYRVELSLAPGQTVVALADTPTLYAGPGVFQFEQRGEYLDGVKGFRFAVVASDGSNPTNEITMLPSLCKSRCIAMLDCDPVDPLAELQRWTLLPPGVDRWRLSSGSCQLPNDKLITFVAD